MGVTEPSICAWCGGSFQASRRGGSAQRFCSPGHRWAYWSAARRWVAKAVDAGLISIQDLKVAETSVHAVSSLLERG